MRHLKPDRILAIHMHQNAHYEQHTNRYIGENVRIAFYTQISEDDIDWLLTDVDVLYTAETPYDYRILEQARLRGVRTVVQANHEFFRWLPEPDLTRPDLFVSPSTWHFHEWPDPKLLLPFPVARDQLPRRPISEARTFLHVAGHRAAKDRNGTNLIAMALRSIRSSIRLIIRSQSRIPALAGRSPRHVQLDIRKQQDLAHYSELYSEGDVLVLPRHYGGQSLPMLEAMAIGMPIITLDVEPQNRFLPREGLIRPATRHHIPSQAGFIAWWDIRARDLAARIDVFANDPEMIARLSDESDQIAECQDWDTWGTEAYTRMLETLAHDGADQAARLRLWCAAGIPFCEPESCTHEHVPVA